MNIVPGNNISSEQKKDSRESFIKLFHYYYPRVIAYVSSIVEDNVAEDITQDVFLYVWENHKKLSLEEGFHSYLFQAAYTRCLDYFRKTHNIKKYNQQTFNEYIEKYRLLLDDDCKTIKSLYAKDFYERLYCLLNEIPPERREVFIMTYFKGMKAKEIAETLGMPQRTVESHIYLTVKYLKSHMSKNDFFLLLLFFKIVY
ncbi:MAG: RNA polymerase sigma-70 factor [Tannerellaceae bacterium]|nr:RNA polymerase sigma-70 factor [Tannerellaceae bacterium]